MQPHRARNGSATVTLLTVEREAVMARSDPVPPAHPTDRIVGNAPVIQALRAQIRHLARVEFRATWLGVYIATEEPIHAVDPRE